MASNYWAPENLFLAIKRLEEVRFVCTQLIDLIELEKELLPSLTDVCGIM